MNVELCKKLKEAGFPQTGDSERWTLPSEGNAYIPTLEELIEACGDRFEELRKEKHDSTSHWLAISYSCDNCDWKDAFFEHGETPSEAVANLWLKLNKK